ncbi:MAG: L-glyceraldehyde 3-phosphate reductase [Oscillospiraceae bacterium]
MNIYTPSKDRYENMRYRKCGNSGLFLPAISLGLWHNFGEDKAFSLRRDMILEAFDLGITHFDIANNYSNGEAETFFGKMLKNDLAPYRDELIISTKAGYDMWQGPYGTQGSSRKYLMASIDQSLTRLGIPYVDIFYSHCFNQTTPLEETMNALFDIVKQGKALYVGISSYDDEKTKQACEIMKNSGVPLLIHQPSYNMLNRWIEPKLQPVLNEYGVGSIAFCPLAQGLLTTKYLNEIPKDSRASEKNSTIGKDEINEAVIKKLNLLNAVAKNRGQTLAQMSLAWVLRDEKVTSAIIGASRVSQIQENVKAIDNLNFSTDELEKIDNILIAD